MLWFNELFFKPLENYFCKFCFKAVKKSRVTHDNGYKRRLQSQITASYSNELRLDVKARRKQKKVNFFLQNCRQGENCLYTTLLVRRDQVNSTALHKSRANFIKIVLHSRHQSQRPRQYSRNPCQPHLREKNRKSKATNNI